MKSSRAPTAQLDDLCAADRRSTRAPGTRVFRHDALGNLTASPPPGGGTTTLSQDGPIASRIIIRYVIRAIGANVPSS